MIISNRVTNTTVTTILRIKTSNVITNTIANTIIACQGPKKKAKSVIIESQNYTYVQLYAENARDQR